MWNTGNFVLSEAFLVIFISCISVSIAAGVTRITVNTAHLLEDEKNEIAEIEKEGMERWSGCQICIETDTDLS